MFLHISFDQNAVDGQQVEPLEEHCFSWSRIVMSLEQVRTMRTP